MPSVLFCHGATDRLQAAAAWLWHAQAENGNAATVGTTATTGATIVYAPDAEMARRLDQLLWTAPATGFIPHCRSDAPLAGETPLLIAECLDHLPPLPSADTACCLLNLGNELLPDFERFARLVEIVSADDATRLAARERVKTYRDRGYDIRFRDLTREPL